MHRTLVPACWPSPGRVLCAALMLGLAFAPAAQAQYKWKDARGQLHASDMPPPADIPERQVLQRPAGQRAAPGSPNAAVRASGLRLPDIKLPASCGALEFADCARRLMATPSASVLKRGSSSSFIGVRPSPRATSAPASG